MNAICALLSGEVIASGIGAVTAAPVSRKWAGHLQFDPAGDME
jgi:hypothetical protein